MVVPFTKAVKTLVIINVAIWFVFQLILERFVLESPVFTHLFSVVPQSILTKFFVWQPFTYMFLHSTSPFHILFNMLMLWWLGGELEQRWGTRFFTTYYLVSGVGAGLIYFIFTVVFALTMNQVQPLITPMLGASGAVFGLMLAYGIVFGERVVYFLFMFPMKAKYFMLILGGLQLMYLIGSLAPGSTSDGVAHLAHLGGIVSGYLFLLFWTKRQGRRARKNTAKRGRRLKLVVSNDDEKQGNGPKYWN
jgi:membrane associated rhomboid family serine protease